LKAPMKDWGVRVVGDQIGDIAPHQELLARYPFDNVWEATNQVLAPGFVNAHTHLYGVLAHGIPLTHAPSGFWPFLKDFWWPRVEDQLNHDWICTATDLQCARMINSGVTSFYDCTEAPNSLPGVLFAQANIVRHHGLRGILSFEATERLSPENGQLGLRENWDFIQACDLEGGMVSGILCFHTTFTCSANFIRQAFELGRDRGVPIHMHCSEGTFEPEYTIKNFGMRTLHYYDSLGVTGPDMIASQCVQINNDEIALVAKKGIRVVHMPLSNCEVGGGISPVPELVKAGVMIGLGSDGYIDDFFEIMRGAFLIHKANLCDPRVMPADQVWHLATEGGAKVLGLINVGQVAKGWQADLQLIDADLPTPLDEHNLYEQLLLYRNQTNVRATIVAGQVLMRDGEIINADMDILYARTRRAASQLWSRSNEVVKPS